MKASHIISSILHETPWVIGKDLTPEEQKHVKSAYVHRYTGEHKPKWADKKKPNGEPSYRVQHKDDADWLANTQFMKTNRGKLNRRYKHCLSNPAWPDNPELRRSVPESTEIIRLLLSEEAE